MRIVSRLLAVSCCLSTPAWAADKPLFAPVPAWVKPVSAPERPTSDSTAPITFLLMDQQLRFADGQMTIFSAMRIRIDSPAGLTAGNISLPWRPDVGDLTVHRLVIHRGGKEIDVIAAGQTFTVVRREANLESATLDGVLTANIQPEGLQVGDVLELVTSTTARDPVLAGRIDQAVGFGAPTPISRAHLRIVWPMGTPLRVQAGGGLVLPKPARVGDQQVVDYSVDDLRPVQLPKLAPPRFQLGRFVEMSDFAAWRDVGALLAPLYDRASMLPATGSLADEVARIRSASADPKARATAALALVQDRIRYVALAMGSGGLVPADVATTWARRYGDCKAKTAMLLAILRALDIPADPVAVSTAFGDGVDRRLPAVSAFDHVLVRAIVAGKTYWLDGTRTGDTSLDRLAVPGFGWGLPVVARNAALVRMQTAPLPLPTSDLAITIDATKGLGVPAPAKLTRVLRGDGAIASNAALEQLSGGDRDRALREMWKGQFDFVDPETTTASFNAASGELTLELTGKARMDWSTGWYETDGLGLGYRADLAREPGPDRDAPFLVGHPFYTRTVETIRLPNTFPPKVPIEKLAINRTVGGVEYRRSGGITDRVFRAEATQRSLMSEFSASDAPATQAALREMAAATVYIQKPNEYRQTSAELATGDQTPPTTIAGLLERGYSLIERQRFDDAIATFSTVLKQEPKNADAIANRGLSYVYKNDLTAAERDLTAARELQPRHPVVLRGSGLLAERRGDQDGAFKLYSDVLANSPNDGFALFNRARVAGRLGKTDVASADYGKLLAASPGNGELRLGHFNLLVKVGRKEEAAATMRAGMKAAAPGDTYPFVAAGTALASIGLTDEALNAFDRALAIEPDAYIYQNRASIRSRTDYAGRMADLDSALKLDSALVEALADKGQLLVEPGQFDSALAAYDAVLKIEPDSAPVLGLRGIARLRKGMNAAAAQDFQDARKLAASNAGTLNLLCWGKATAGVAFREALAECDAALAIMPDAVGMIDSRAFVLLRLDRNDDAIAGFSKALARSPNATSLYGRSIAYRRKGDLARAEQDRQAAIKIDVRIADKYLGYGLTQ